MNKISLLFIAPFLFIFQIFIFNQTLADSKKLEVIIVKKGDNITQICKKYEMTKTEFLKLNNLSGENLKKGSKVEVYKKSNEGLVVSEQKVKIQQKPIKEEICQYHIVKKGDNLTQISNKYNISKKDLILLNHLEGEKVKIDQKIYLVKKVDKSKDESIKIHNEVISDSFQLITIKEKVIANYIEDDNLIRNKSIALHYKAKEGTIIKITNLINGKSTSVKVIGRIPISRFQEKIGIQITKSIAKRLGVVDQFFRCELTYVAKVKK